MDSTLSETTAMIRKELEEMGFPQTDADKIRDICDTRLDKLYGDVLGFLKESAEDGARYRIWPISHKPSLARMEAIKQKLIENGFQVKLRRKWPWTIRGKEAYTRRFLEIRW